MKILKIILGILVAIFLVVGVPIIINECYKANCGYITVWDGADVLGYYGAILGSIIAVATLAITIVFTKKQIQRENHLNWQNEKWDRLEAVFMKILESIDPIEVLKYVMDTGYTDPSKAINHLQKLQVNCRVACDLLNANLNASDYPKFKSLIDSIATTSEEFATISQKLVDIYSDFRLFNHRDTALKTLEMEEKHPGSFSQEDIIFNKDVLRKTENMTFPDIKKQVTATNDSFIQIYETQYKKLLQLKGSTFEVVRRDTRQYADNILSLRRK